eukprot:CAMPEP_0119168286 /NCGR_PEP_ID=MMETSP1315-20130426/7114_1 /TAXON_ID=676789 /ORGANISM="Prasinoderma singularis, Strain RCC927" /LENGTH=39 /DNA_ID= /DNA_START= /DNA_END= /DNA_ORIENTATION=
MPSEVNLPSPGGLIPTPRRHRALRRQRRTQNAERTRQAA